MKKFLVLYKAPIEEMKEAMKNSNPEESKKSMDEWTAWMETNKDHFADKGSSVGKTKRVDATGVTDSSNDIGGYSIVQAEDADAAAAIFADGPHTKMTPSSWVEISEITEM